MSTNDPRIKLNHAWWNERAGKHRQTELYKTQIAKLQAGELALLPMELGELRELGDLTGRQVLHLQCHIGTDTVSLARLGASGTGVDFSEVAIAEAKKLSQELGIPALPCLG